MRKMKIVIVEDNESIRTELKEFLERNGYDVGLVGKFNQVVEDVLDEKPDLLLLDLNLPFTDGYTICRRLRKKSSVPIIVVTSRNTEKDEWLSMDTGADDFVTKPYNTKILLARICALLKRSYPQKENQILCAGVELNLSDKTVAYGGKKALLTKNEFGILSVLMERVGEIISREELMHELWQTDEFVDENTLTVNMKRLRKTLDSIGLEGFIFTRRGMGYGIEEQR